MNEACLAGENSEFSTRGVLDALARDSNAADYYVSRCAEISDGERIFFITSSGIVGTGPLSATIGDVIVYTENMSMPLVLRVDGDSQYKLIGPAFFYSFRWESVSRVGYDYITLS